MPRRNLKDPRTPAQRRRDAIAARNRAWVELSQSLPLPAVLMNADGHRVEGRAQA